MRSRRQRVEVEVAATLHEMGLVKMRLRDLEASEAFLTQSLALKRQLIAMCVGRVLHVSAVSGTETAAYCDMR